MNFSRNFVLALTISSASPCQLQTLHDAGHAPIEAGLDAEMGAVPHLPAEDGAPPTDDVAIPIAAIGTMALATFSNAASWKPWLDPSTHVSHDAAFEKVAKAIVQIAAMGNAIIIGRGGSILCSEMRNCFHFRIEAGFDWRVASIMKRLDMAQGEAEEMVKTNTKLREKFISQCLGENIAELRHYSAVFNNERCSVQEMAAANPRVR